MNIYSRSKNMTKFTYMEAEQKHIDNELQILLIRYNLDAP